VTRLPPAVIGDAYTDDHCIALLEELVGIGNRMAGQAGERAGVELLEGRFEGIGLRDVSVEEFDLPGWWRGSSSLSTDRWTATDQHELLALPGGPSGDVSAELVDLGHGMPEAIEAADVDGKLVLVRSDSPPDEEYVHRMVKYAAAVESGAAGFLYRNHVEGCLPPTGDVGYHDRPGEIPAVGVSAELGARIERACNREPVEADLSVDCRNEATTSANVGGDLGPDTEAVVLVSAHVDAHDIAEGAMDNGAGCALVAETARLVAAAEDDLDTRVRCITFGAEEVGLYGAYHAAESFGETVKCVLNVDGAGGSRDPRLSSNGFDAVTEAFEAVTADLDVPLRVDDEVSPHADDWAFCERGIPAVTLGSVTEGSGRGWGHTHADTLEKLDSRDLRALAVVLAETVVELADADRECPGTDPGAIREALDRNAERELRAGGRWHFG